MAAVTEAARGLRSRFWADHLRPRLVKHMQALRNALDEGAATGPGVKVNITKPERRKEQVGLLGVRG